MSNDERRRNLVFAIAIVLAIGGPALIGRDLGQMIAICALMVVAFILGIVMEVNG